MISSQGAQKMWQDIASYPVDEIGCGKSVPVAWKRDRGAVIRMAGGYFHDGEWNWYDHCNGGERLEQPDYWFDLPSLPR